MIGDVIINLLQEKPGLTFAEIRDELQGSDDATFVQIRATIATLAKNDRIVNNGEKPPRWYVFIGDLPQTYPFEVVRFTYTVEALMTVTIVYHDGSRRLQPFTEPVSFEQCPANARKFARGVYIFPDAASVIFQPVDDKGNPVGEPIEREINSGYVAVFIPTTGN